MTTPTPKRPRGRPPKPEGTAADVRVDVYLTPTQAAQLDAERGDTPRSVWLRERAGLR